ncbi:MAG: hypothetical protein HYS57_01800 [Parcubacteria group bacterium]|nr:hypothetical protein [Parcubacteria group bacterium]
MKTLIITMTMWLANITFLTSFASATPTPAQILVVSPQEIAQLFEKALKGGQIDREDGLISLAYKKDGLRQYVVFAGMFVSGTWSIYTVQFLEERWEKHNTGQTVVETWAIIAGTNGVLSQILHERLIFQDETRLIESKRLVKDRGEALRIVRRVVKQFLSPRR